MMVTVRTYTELAEAVRRDEVMLRLEAEAKYFYEQNVGDAIGGGVVGALPGLLLGGPAGGLAAGIGSALYDALGGGYDFINVLITLVSKFLMAFV